MFTVGLHLVLGRLYQLSNPVPPPLSSSSSARVSELKRGFAQIPLTSPVKKAFLMTTEYRFSLFQRVQSCRGDLECWAKAEGRKGQCAASGQMWPAPPQLRLGHGLSSSLERVFAACPTNVCRHEKREGESMTLSTWHRGERERGEEGPCRKGWHWQWQGGLRGERENEEDIMLQSTCP